VNQTLDSTRRSSAHAAAVGGSIGGAFALLLLGLYIFISYQHKIEAKHPLSSHPGSRISVRTTNTATMTTRISDQRRERSAAFFRMSLSPPFRSDAPHRSEKRVEGRHREREGGGRDREGSPTPLEDRSPQGKRHQSLRMSAIQSMDLTRGPGREEGAADVEGGYEEHGSDCAESGFGSMDLGLGGGVTS
jgi:hypothetical protein